MYNTLTNIKLENPLSTTQNTMIAFQKQHPNLNFIAQEISQHQTQLKNKNEIICKHSKSKPWTLTKGEYLLKLDKNFLTSLQETLQNYFMSDIMIQI